MLRTGFEHITVVVAPAGNEVLRAVAVAVFEYVPQLKAEVPLVMCTEAPTPAANVKKSQANVWLPTAPVMAHVPGPP